MSNEILIYIELNDEKQPVPVVFELAQKAQELSKKLNCEVNGLLITPNFQTCEETLRTPFDKVYVVQDERLKNYSTEYYSKIAIDVVKQVSPQILLIGATTQGRDIAPQITSALETGLTADCTGLDINDKGMLAATRPTFGGKLMATILCKNFPQTATVRPKVLKSDDVVELKPTQYIEMSADIENIELKVNLLEVIKKSVNSSLEDAEIIVAGGRGMRDKDGFNMLYELAKKLNATVGASRLAVESGFADSSIQIGQTGKTVTPKIYIACGISGAIQHTVGMSGSKKIIAINKDANAPIFKIADFGVVGDVFDVLPELIKNLN
ncbi:MAG: electron transfer flavoprotein subunit alpha/FixB family protein [Candidatus Melainabacteria bacterium]|nr:MAG: electron transfer flavoprotein subunit alpha/FixB family protein [Candidatus Melainabacteria bacterium]